MARESITSNRPRTYVTITIIAQSARIPDQRDACACSMSSLAMIGDELNAHTVCVCVHPVVCGTTKSAHILSCRIVRLTLAGVGKQMDMEEGDTIDAVRKILAFTQMRLVYIHVHASYQCHVKVVCSLYVCMYVCVCVCVCDTATHLCVHLL